MKFVMACFTCGLYLLFSSLLFSGISAADDVASPVPLLLAKGYTRDVDLGDYWVSEKLDGMRAYWDGEQLTSRGGNLIHAPGWFTASFPEMPLDGELWTGRGQFERVVSIVRTSIPNDDHWREVSFMVFDAPALDLPFSERLARFTSEVSKAGTPWLRTIEQFRLQTHDQLMTRLAEIERLGGEGLMLHRAASFYHGGRSDDLLKVKSWQDAEAVVVEHLPGKGKYQGILGSLLVEDKDGRRFRIGTGLSDEQRKNPPAIGQLVTYRYQGLTKNGAPRFASFMRVRDFD